MRIAPEHSHLDPVGLDDRALLRFVLHSHFSIPFVLSNPKNSSSIPPVNFSEDSLGGFVVLVCRPVLAKTVANDVSEVSGLVRGGESAGKHRSQRDLV